MAVLQRAGSPKVVAEAPVHRQVAAPESVEPTGARFGTLRPCARAALLAAALFTVAVTSLPAASAGPQRSSFPGRRIGGATRGECSARLIAHLVPVDSVYAPGASRVLGILEGPTGNPRPVQVSFRAESGGAASSLNLPAMGPGITLFRQPVLQGPTVWETSYRCASGSTPADAAAADPMAFVSNDSPPALSLLVSDATPEDVKVQQSLQSLRKACGGSIARAELARSFGLSDVLTSDWPEQLPVRCPG